MKKLTSAADESVQIWVRIADITSLYVVEGNTVVVFSTTDFSPVVKETPEEILRMN